MDEDVDTKVLNLAEKYNLLVSDLFNHDVQPSRKGLEPHQVWVWLAGAKPPHWEVRGTGVI